jgi:hypothetical protein
VLRGDRQPKQPSFIGSVALEHDVHAVRALAGQQPVGRNRERAARPSSGPRPEFRTRRSLSDGTEPARANAGHRRGRLAASPGPKARRGITIAPGTVTQVFMTRLRCSPGPGSGVLPRQGWQSVSSGRIWPMLKMLQSWQDIFVAPPTTAHLGRTQTRQSQPADRRSVAPREGLMDQNSLGGSDRLPTRADNDKGANRSFAITSPLVELPNGGGAIRGIRFRSSLHLAPPPRLDDGPRSWQLHRHLLTWFISLSSPSPAAGAVLLLLITRSSVLHRLVVSDPLRRLGFRHRLADSGVISVERSQHIRLRWPFAGR